MLPVVLIFFFLALFDSVGTLIGVGERAGLMRDGTLPRAREALLADALGTVAGARTGDVHRDGLHRERRRRGRRGGRTGLTAMVTAVLFLLSLFFYPIIRMIGAGYPAGATTLYPVIAPPLVLVGTLMIGGLRHVPWDDPAEAIPAFLTVFSCRWP